MGNILYSYHTHAKGEEYGWWGVIWHPAHFDDEGKEIPNSSWKLEVHGAEYLDKARHDLLIQWLNQRDNLFPSHNHEEE